MPSEVGFLRKVTFGEKSLPGAPSFRGWFVLAWPQERGRLSFRSFPTVSVEFVAILGTDITQRSHSQEDTTLIEEFQLAWGWVKEHKVFH